MVAAPALDPLHGQFNPSVEAFVFRKHLRTLLEAARRARVNMLLKYGPERIDEFQWYTILYGPGRNKARRQFSRVGAPRFPALLVWRIPEG